MVSYKFMVDMNLLLREYFFENTFGVTTIASFRSTKLRANFGSQTKVNINVTLKGLVVGYLLASQLANLFW